MIAVSQISKMIQRLENFYSPSRKHPGRERKRKHERCPECGHSDTRIRTNRTLKYYGCVMKNNMKEREISGTITLIKTQRPDRLNNEPG